ncbi:MAG TPA: DUF4180 domain-containing protein [Cytophagaceae bacterium]
MEIKIAEFKNQKIADLTSEKNIIKNAQDALELLMNCIYQGSNKIVISEANLPADFFDLKTGLAGDILQKFSNYEGYLAIVGDYSKYTSNSLKAFIYESNKQKRISFVSSKEEAIEALL